MNGMLRISAIVCTYNGERYLLETLESLEKQSLDKSLYEIVIVDNNSTNSVPMISQEFMADNPHFQVQYKVEKQAGLSFARNCGIQTSKAPYIVFIDDDATANEQFLEKHLEVYDRFENVVAAGGKVLGVYPEGRPPMWLTHYIEGVFSLIDRGEELKKFDEKFPVGCNMSFRKSALEEMGGFNTNVKYRSDEKFVFLNLQQQQKEIYYTPQAIAYHNIDGEKNV